MASEEEDMPVNAALSLDTTAAGTVLSDTGKYAACVPLELLLSVLGLRV